MRRMYRLDQIPFLLLLLLSSGSSFSQKKDEVFRISKKPISLRPNLDTLLDKNDYLFSLDGFSIKNVYRLQFSGGTAKVKDSLILIHTQTTPSAGRKYSIKVFTKRNKIVEEVYQKNFIIPILVSAPDSEPPISRRNQDLFMTNYPYQFPTAKKDTLTRDAALARINDILGTFQPISISHSPITVYFKLSVKCTGSLESFTAAKLQLSAEMVQRLNETGTGCVIIIDKINIHSAHDPPNDISYGPYLIHIRN
jgi:hypothetical protein